ncbi:MAG: YebC/PmpR family DNA-binding transcriptional regulator [Patescibacteria group bacterium]|nr:YebC/PmpR family DNA-binding transcriptional regulator [Patescibacteria group bacterium]
MSGHSKWAQIKRQKGVADVKRGMMFTKIANAITIATRLGNSGDPNTNPRLREALEEARKINMPKENVQRAIDRGLGNLPGQTLEEVLYEGFGPGRVAFLVEGVTDNKLRTNQIVKSLFEHSGGALGGQGSVAYMFERKGELKVKGKGGEVDDEMLELIDLGAEDVDAFTEEGENKYLIYVEGPELYTMGNKITQSGFAVEESGLVFKPTTTMQINDKEIAQKILDFTEKLEDQDDIQKVFANFDIPENIL